MSILSVRTTTLSKIYADTNIIFVSLLLKFFLFTLRNYEE